MSFQLRNGEGSLYRDLPATVSQGEVSYERVASVLKTGLAHFPTNNNFLTTVTSLL